MKVDQLMSDPHLNRLNGKQNLKRKLKNFGNLFKKEECKRETQAIPSGSCIAGGNFSTRQ